jgi:hypothetical protein
MSDERNAGDSTSEQRSLTTLIEFWAYGLSRTLKSALQPTIFWESAAHVADRAVYALQRV